MCQNIQDEIDKIVDINAEVGMGIGGNYYIGPVEGTFIMKLGCWEIDEHGKVEMKTEGELGVNLFDLGFSGGGSYNYTTKKKLWLDWIRQF